MKPKNKEGEFYQSIGSIIWVVKSLESSVLLSCSISQALKTRGISLRRRIELFQSGGGAADRSSSYTHGFVIGQKRKRVPPAATIAVPKDIMSSDRWTKEQLKLAFHLYCQLPFGKMHSRNREIVELASLIGRTPSAVAMKLVNLASLDPAITSTGRSGLGNASVLDREVWNEFHADWEGLALECEQLRRSLGTDTRAESPESDSTNIFVPEDYSAETCRVIAEQRVKQHFFRRAVLSSYRGRCCMSGLSESRLLIASHIVPWSKDKTNRLNPSNGLCLSAIHDRAFDQGLITLTDDLRIVLSKELRKSHDDFVTQVLLPLNGRQIEVPERFAPNPAFVARHRSEVFVDSETA